jgi:hypothetical protein
MRIVIAFVVVILGFCVMLLFGTLSVLQDLFALSAHQIPAIPGPEADRQRQHEDTDLRGTSQTMG